jgi:preprotein translocase subunit SecY
MFSFGQGKGKRKKRTKKKKKNQTDQIERLKATDGTTESWNKFFNLFVGLPRGGNDLWLFFSPYFFFFLVFFLVDLLHWVFIHFFFSLFSRRLCAKQVASVLGTGILGLPIKLAKTGFTPFLFTYSVCLVMQVIIFLPTHKTK